jgi:hypothetical protein
MRGKMRPFGCTEFKRCGFLKNLQRIELESSTKHHLGWQRRDADLALSAQLAGRSATLRLGLSG